MNKKSVGKTTLEVIIFYEKNENPKSKKNLPELSSKLFAASSEKKLLNSFTQVNLFTKKLTNVKLYV